MSLENILVSVIVICTYNLFINQIHQQQQSNQNNNFILREKKKSSIYLHIRKCGFYFEAAVACYFSITQN